MTSIEMKIYLACVEQLQTRVYPFIHLKRCARIRHSILEFISNIKKLIIAQTKNKRAMKNAIIDLSVGRKE